MTEDIGASVRRLRESLGWSQYQLAQKLPMSQKQVSRIENHQVVEIPRATLIRLAEVLRTPLITGEVNRWLYLSGYRPYIYPGLPLPPNADAIVSRFDPYPCALVDVAGSLDACNAAMRRLFSTFAMQPPIGRSLVCALFQSLRRDDPLVSPTEITFMVRRLLLEWSLYPEAEAWIHAAKTQIATELGSMGQKLIENFRPDTELLTPMPAEFVVKLPSVHPLPRFFITEVAVSRRPDLGLYVLYPLNPSAKAWCLDQSATEPALT